MEAAHWAAIVFRMRNPPIALVSLGVWYATRPSVFVPLDTENLV